MKQVFIFLLCSSLGGLVGCGPSIVPDIQMDLTLTAAEIQAGERAVRLYCATCHGIGDNTFEEMLAPSLWSVRQHYGLAHPEPEAFVSAMMKFMDQPHSAEILMPLAYEEYGLMLMMPVEEAQLLDAVRLICAGHVERPIWARDYDKAHQECYQRLLQE